MNGLRMYVPTAINGRPADEVYYSRRGNGPYYRWLYGQETQAWTVSRVISHDDLLLSLATWKTIPLTLRTRLSEHYSD